MFSGLIGIVPCDLLTATGTPSHAFSDLGWNLISSSSGLCFSLQDFSMWCRRSRNTGFSPLPSLSVDFYGSTTSALTLKDRWLRGLLEGSVAITRFLTVMLSEAGFRWRSGPDGLTFSEQELAVLMVVSLLSFLSLLLPQLV